MIVADEHWVRIGTVCLRNTYRAHRLPSSRNLSNLPGERSPLMRCQDCGLYTWGDFVIEEEPW